MLYTALAIGALSAPVGLASPEETATTFINKAWNILVERLVPKHADPDSQVGILRNLYVLAYSYLRFFNNQLMVAYLEDLSHIILQNLAAAAATSSNASQAQLLDSSRSLFWAIYVLTSSNRPHGPPPKFHRFILSLTLASRPDPLGAVLRSLGDDNAGNMLGDPMEAEIVACALLNEANQFANDASQSVFSNKSQLERAIINAMHCAPVGLTNETYSCIFEALKSRLILGSPEMFRVLFSLSIYPVSHTRHWDLLSAALRTHAGSTDLINFVSESSLVLYSVFSNELLAVWGKTSLSTPTHTTAFLKVSCAIMFNSKFVKMAGVDLPLRVRDLSIIDIENICSVLLGWYMAACRQLLQAAIAHNGTPGEAVQSENSYDYSADQVLACLLKLADVQHLASLDQYLVYHSALARVCNSWLSFLGKTSHWKLFQENMARFMLAILAHIVRGTVSLVGDVYMRNDMLHVLHLRSTSSTLDVSLSSGGSRSSISAAPPSLGQAPLPSLPATSKYLGSNYVLIHNRDLTPPQTSIQLAAGTSPGSSLRQLPGIVVGGVPPNPSQSFVLPPLHAAVGNRESRVMK